MQTLTEAAVYRVAEGLDRNEHVKVRNAEIVSDIVLGVVAVGLTFITHCPLAVGAAIPLVGMFNKAVIPKCFPKHHATQHLLIDRAEVSLDLLATLTARDAETMRSPTNAEIAARQQAVHLCLESRKSVWALFDAVSGHT